MAGASCAAAQIVTVMLVGSDGWLGIITFIDHLRELLLTKPPGRTGDDDDSGVRTQR